MITIDQERVLASHKARNDFEYYCRLVLRDDFGNPIKIAKHQRSWIEACQKMGDEPEAGHKTLIIAPPGSGKSVLLGIGFISWMIGKFPYKHIGLISYADKVAHDRALSIRNLIAGNKAYKLPFPSDIEWAEAINAHPVIPDRTSWGKSNFRLLRDNEADPHPTLRAGGAMSSVVAYRLNGLVIDDPMDIKNSATSDLREKTFKNYENAIVTRLTDGAWQLCIGTRFADDDFIGRIMKRGGWNVIHVTALTKSGKTYWPEAYSQAFMEEKRIKSPSLFYTQYMGDTKMGSLGIIKKLQTYGGEIEVKKNRDIPAMTTGKIHDSVILNKLYLNGEEIDLLIGFGIDAALKDKQQNDYTVIYIGGIDKTGKLWIIDRIKDRMGTPELVNKILELYAKYHPFTIWIEDAAGGTPAIQTLMAETPYLPTIPVNPTHGGKRSRANALSPYLHGGHVLFPKESVWFEDAEHYLTHFGSTDYDDDLDALFVLCNNLLSIKHPDSYSSENRPKLKISMR